MKSATLRAMALVLAVGVVSISRADEAAWMGGAAPHTELRSGGVLAQSYGYHRQSPAAAPSITPAAGWHGYGFPVKTTNWGWFGAARYYPTVHWHRGYYGDQRRWGYRSGY